MSLKPATKTLFFGGIGTAGGYLEDMRAALAEAGMPEPTIAGKALLPWAGLRESLLDKLLQLACVPVLRHGRSPFPWCSWEGAPEGAILIGYSFGGLIAAHLALAGPAVARLILIATPASPALHRRLRMSERIAELIVHDIPGDPVRAGMPLWQLVAALPRLAMQFRRMEGHFLYARTDAQGHVARRQLIAALGARPK